MTVRSVGRGLPPGDDRSVPVQQGECHANHRSCGARVADDPELAADQAHRQEDGQIMSAGIDVGVYFDLRNPQQWRQNPSRLYSFTLEACEEAERLGASSVWFSEHHLFDDDYLASPLTFAAAVAARTSRVRLGTAIVIAPLHHPAELAEQSVLVDLVSDGRLDQGIGAGYRDPEFDLYDASLKTRCDDTDGTAYELRKLWPPR